MPAENEDPPQDEYIFIPPGEMQFIRDSLVKAELARKKGHMDEAFTAYSDLAGYYQVISVLES
jgi:hypothetical protein